MSEHTDNIVEFPLHRRRRFRGCPQCGTRSDTWQIGRLVWGYCTTHELRWIMVDLNAIPPVRADRKEIRRGLEFLSNYVEVSS